MPTELTLYPDNAACIRALRPMQQRRAEHCWIPLNTGLISGELIARGIIGMLLCLALGGCEGMPGTATEADYTIATGIVGIDHLPGHLAVQSFSVDGFGGGRAGGGSGMICCMRLPSNWQPDMVVRVNWGVTNFRDCKADEYVTHVAVERYEEVGTLYAHFFADGSVRVVSSNYGPWKAANPESEYPVKTPIPQKDPWHRYPLDKTCAGKARSVAPTKHEEGDVDYGD